MVKVGLQRDGAFGLQVERSLQIVDPELQATDSLFQFPRFRSFVGCDAGERRNRRLTF